LGISNTNLQNGISNTSALKKLIGISNTDWYFGCRLVLRVPIGTSGANFYFKCRLLL
jgi:hypothetical protein